MRVPLLDLSEQYRLLAEPIRQEIDETLRTQNFILGPKVAEFERALADYCGARHAIGVSSGTDALLAILMALDVGPGDAVVTTAYTFLRLRAASRVSVRRPSLSTSTRRLSTSRRPRSRDS